MSITTAVVIIGNSDDKLTQGDWAQFVFAVDHQVRKWAGEVFFHGFPPSNYMWQNASWVFSIHSQDIPDLPSFLSTLTQLYEQDSIAWLQGETQFITPKKEV